MFCVIFPQLIIINDILLNPPHRHHCDHQESLAVYPAVPGLQPSPYYKFRLQRVLFFPPELTTSISGLTTTTTIIIIIITTTIIIITIIIIFIAHHR